MKSILLIRHGEPDFPGGRRMCLGRTDLPLSALGRLQAALLGLALKPAALYSSPLRRAVQTARPMGGPIELAGLAERDAGEWDGLAFEEIRSRWPELWERRGSQPGLPMPGAEPDGAALARFKAAVDSLPDGAAAVSHAGVIGLYLESLGAGRVKLPYGAYVEIRDGRAGTPGALPHPELDDAACEALLRAAGNPEKVVHHCAAVADVAEGLARGLGMDARRVRQAAYLHDIARLLPDHAHAGALWLEALGYGSLAPLVRGHMTHPGDVLDEAGAVCLADKLVLHGRRCSVDERFAASREKCKTPEARAAHAERYAEAKRLETLAKERGVIL